MTDEPASNEQTRSEDANPVVGRVRRKKRHDWVKVLAVGLFVVSLLPLFSAYSLPCDLCSHFRVYCVLFLLMTALLIFLGNMSRVFLIPIMVALVINAAAIFPLFFGSVKQSPDANFKIMTANVNSKNPNHAWIVKRFEESGADVICVQEISPVMADYFASHLNSYPHQLVVPRADNFGIGTYSRHPFVSKEIIGNYGDAEKDKNPSASNPKVDLLKVGIKFGDKSVSIFNVHTVPPYNDRCFNWRNDEMSQVAEMSASLEGPVIVTGDLNCTYFSTCFQKFLEKGQLKDSEIGFGVQNSWPTNLWIKIPIDHVLYKGDITISDRQLGPVTGSDHRPVVVSFKI